MLPEDKQDFNPPTDGPPANPFGGPPQDHTITRGGFGDPLVGRLLAERYRVESHIGGGGMGNVYKAMQETMQRPVAIKLLKPQYLSDASSLQRFQREAVAASRLNHPNIVILHDFRITPEGQVFLVMDYLRGKSLSDVLKAEDHLSIERFLHIYKQVCDALEHAHRRGVVHRDLKPANIMLVDNEDDPDFVKVVDFGVAKLVADASEVQRLTQTGEVFGSPIYMSPEQCVGEKLDSRSDIYAVGISMYESICGRVPFLGKDILETIIKHKSEDPPRFKQTRPDVYIPDRLEAVILKALAKNPADRQQSMADLKLELEMAVPKPTSRSLRQAAPTREMGFGDRGRATGELAVAAASAVRELRPLNPLVLVVAACLAAAAIGGLCVWFLVQHAGQPPAVAPTATTPPPAVHKTGQPPKPVRPAAQETTAHPQVSTGKPQQTVSHPAKPVHDGASQLKKPRAPRESHRTEPYAETRSPESATPLPPSHVDDVGRWMDFQNSEQSSH